MQKDVNVRVLVWMHGDESMRWGGDARFINDDFKPYATRSLEVAESEAQSDPYIICNDDNLPYGQDFVSKGLAIMERNPEFGCVSGVTVNGGPCSKEGPEVEELHAVGGLVFLRKGLVTEFKPIEDPWWDGYRHAQVVAKGFKSGWARDLPYLHMGDKFSVASPSHFVGA